MKPVTDKLIRFFASVEWSLLLLRASLVFLLLFLIIRSGVWFSDRPVFDMLRRLRDGVLPFRPGGLTLTVLLVVLLLILVHLVVVILVRNSAGGRHLTLSLFQGSLVLLIPVAFLSMLNFQKYAVEVNSGQVMRLLESPDAYELVVTDHSDLNRDKVYAIKWNTLHTGKVLRQEDWDFHIRVNVRYQHAVFANLLARQINRGKQTYGITANQGYAVEQEFKMFSAKPNEQNAGPGILIEIFDFDNESLGTFLLGCGASPIIPPQEFGIGGHTWSVELRNRRFDPGFHWQVLKGENETESIIRFEEPDKKPIEQTIGFFHSVVYKGFRFRTIPDPCNSPIGAESCRVSISRNPWGNIFAATALLTMATAFLHVTVWLLRKEGNAE